MATDRAAQWIEPSGRESVTGIAETSLRAAATAVDTASARKLASRALVSARAWAAQAAANTSAGAASSWRRLQSLARPVAPDPGLSVAILWVTGLGAGVLVLDRTGSWQHALITGTCVFALVTLSSMRNAQQREALAVSQQLEELRQSLRVTHALLDVDVLDGAEHLDAEPDEYRESGTRRLPRP